MRDGNGGDGGNEGDESQRDMAHWRILNMKPNPCSQTGVEWRACSHMANGLCNSDPFDSDSYRCSSLRYADDGSVLAQDFEVPLWYLIAESLSTSAHLSNLLWRTRGIQSVNRQRDSMGKRCHMLKRNTRCTISCRNSEMELRKKSRIHCDEHDLHVGYVGVWIAVEVKKRQEIKSQGEGPECCGDYCCVPFQTAVPVSAQQSDAAEWHSRLNIHLHSDAWNAADHM